MFQGPYIKLTVFGQIVLFFLPAQNHSKLSDFEENISSYGLGFNLPLELIRKLFEEV